MYRRLFPDITEHETVITLFSKNYIFHVCVISCYDYDDWCFAYNLKVPRMMERYGLPMLSVG
jgi:hypothetical protein